MQIAAVQPGDRDRVRQFLEGVVQEANTTIVEDQTGSDDQPADGQDPEAKADAPERSRDGELAERFRGFADDQRSGSD